jgi:hypothetical protein
VLICEISAGSGVTGKLGVAGGGLQDVGPGTTNSEDNVMSDATASAERCRRDARASWQPHQLAASAVRRPGRIAALYQAECTDMHLF